MPPRSPHLSSVDGVRTLLGPTSGVMHAGLLFRVGLADETLARRGITHLAEHLVLHAAGGEGHRNGAIGLEHTYFHTQGDADEVVAFLNDVCAALRDLPMERLDAEKEALRREAAARQAGAPLAMWRYGARGFGLPSYPELGVAGLAPEQLREWVGRHFTRENAVLWIAGEDVPLGLKLELPTGERQPAPRSGPGLPGAEPPGPGLPDPGPGLPGPALPTTPACFFSAGADVAWDTVVRREARAAVFANLLERRMERDLPGPVRVRYEPHAAGTASITATAGGPALSGLVTLLAEMRAGKIDADDVTAVIDSTCAGLREAEERGGRLPGQAFNLAAGRDVQSLSDAIAETRAVTLAAVAEVAAAAYETGLLALPDGADAPAGYAVAPATSESPVPGRRHRARRNRAGHLISGEQGVSVIDGDTVATVRYDACAALLAWPDGARHLIGEDAIVVRVEPTLYRDASAVIRDVDARVPADLRITMPARQPEQIPQPPSALSLLRRSDD